jgi:hypothetical protein
MFISKVIQIQRELNGWKKNNDKYPQIDCLFAILGPKKFKPKILHRIQGAEKLRELNNL